MRYGFSPAVKITSASLCAALHLCATPPARFSIPSDAAQVEHQLTLAHKHRNLLTEAPLKGRKHYRQLIKSHLGLDTKELEHRSMFV